MAKKPNVRIEGLKPLLKSLKALEDDDLNAELKAAHKEGADLVAEAARPLVHIRSGDLLATVRTSATLRSGRVSAGKKAVPYAGPIHWGWPARNIEPDPFLIDGLDERRVQVRERFEAHMASLADRVNESTN